MLSGMPFDPKRNLSGSNAVPPWAFALGLAAAVAVIYFLVAYPQSLGVNWLFNRFRVKE